MRALGFLVLLSAFAAFVVWNATSPGVDTRGLLTQVHDHPVGPQSVGVRLIGMTEFEVLDPGDRRFGRARTGELQDMGVSLRTDEEFSSARGEGAPGIANVTDPDRDHLVYVEVDRGDVLTWSRAATYGDDVVWVNMARDDVLRLGINARDLDCVGERICGRVNDGAYTNVFLLPELPDVLPETCGPNNTFDWAEIDAAWTFAGTRLVEAGSEGRPILRPVNGAICVTPPILE